MQKNIDNDLIPKERQTQKETEKRTETETEMYVGLEGLTNRLKG